MSKRSLVLDALADGPRTVAQMRAPTGLASFEISRAACHLVDMGAIVRADDGRSAKATYALSPAGAHLHPQPLEGPMTAMRQSDIVHAAILGGCETHAQILAATHMAKGSVSRALVQLQDQGLVRCLTPASQKRRLRYEALAPLQGGGRVPPRMSRDEAMAQAAPLDLGPDSSVPRFAFDDLHVARVHAAGGFVAFAEKIGPGPRRVILPVMIPAPAYEARP